MNDTTVAQSQSAAFRDAVDNSMTSTKRRMQTGENGCPEYTDRGVGSDVLALSQMVRGGNPTELIDSVITSGNPNNVADLFVLVFVTRNCRGGKGEKKLSYDAFLRMWPFYPETCASLLELFPMYGCWKDLLQLMVLAKQELKVDQAEDVINAAIAVIKMQFILDLAAVQKHNINVKEALDNADIVELKKKGPNISLLAKWLPRENSSFDKKIGFVSRFLAISESEGNENTVWQSKSKADYRRLVTKLSSYMGLPEVLLASKREDEIRFKKVAARATLLLTKVFLNQTKSGGVRSDDPKRIRLANRFTKYVVKNGLKGGQLMPHEIVERCMNRQLSVTEELVLDAQWKDLWRNVIEQSKTKANEDGSVFSPACMIPLCDVSCSMSGLPMHVAIALSLGISEITHDAFKGMILTFESVPRWLRVKLEGTIAQKVRSLSTAPWDGSTNFEAAYDLILEVAESANLERKDMPSLIVFSDMQFNEAASHRHGDNAAMTTMFESIKQKVSTVANRLRWDDTNMTPIVFWNLRNTGGHPVDKDTEGTVLLSGFSPSLLKLVLSGEALAEEEVVVVQTDGSVIETKIRVTPKDILRKMLDDKLYDPVRAKLVETRESHLADYKVPESEEWVLESHDENGMDIIDEHKQER